jgi:hypothetical protein
MQRVRGGDLAEHNALEDGDLLERQSSTRFRTFSDRGMKVGVGSDAAFRDRMLCAASRTLK